jgi:hypothetical protein
MKDGGQDRRSGSPGTHKETIYRARKKISCLLNRSEEEFFDLIRIQGTSVRFQGPDQAKGCLFDPLLFFSCFLIIRFGYDYLIGINGSAVSLFL